MKRIIRIALVMLALSFQATASPTDAQLPALKAAALAEPSIAACLTAGDDGCVSTWFNAPSTFIVWKSAVTKSEVMGSSSFDWTRVDNLTVGKARIWDQLFYAGAINPSNSNVRAGIDAAWVGTAADLAVRASVYAMCKRAATNAEKALATGTGTTVDPGLLTFEGYVEVNDVARIMER